MKFLVIAVLVAYAAANAIDHAAVVLRSGYEQSPEGGFEYVYETDNGISAQASGKVKAIGKDEIALEVTGSSQHKSPEGEIIQLSYVADEFGFHPQGSHLPTPPPTQPIPVHILRALEYIQAHPYIEKKL